jgi:aspartyl-tRNA(Asn)/glutamyl-tRNA(Gln) amidotransferase subunit B
MSWTTVVGLEIHAQMATRTKMFCACKRGAGSGPNQNVCPVCVGWPGALPVLQAEAVRCAIRAALCLDCEIQENSRFDRKNYFYPDSPKGYQISQFYYPYALRGAIPFTRDDGTSAELPLVRIHMEEDAGKSVHEDDGTSRIDLNRCSSPLLEIVTEPLEMTGTEAASCVRSVRDLLRWVGVCDGDMEKGNLRCDVNVSIMPEGAAEFGTRTELKNLNSFVSIERSVLVESARQKEVLADGGEIRQETRLWDQDREITESMRGKEDSPDYRYFPEPDLPAVKICQADIDAQRDSLPEMPEVRLSRWLEDYGFPQLETVPLMARRENGDYLERVISEGAEPAAASNWFRGEILRHLNDRQEKIEDFPIPAADLAALIAAVKDDRISGGRAKNLLQESLDQSVSLGELITQAGDQVQDEDALSGWVDQVLQGNPDAVSKIQSGDMKPMGFLMGQIMRLSSGQAHPKKVQELIRLKLSD